MRRFNGAALESLLTRLSLPDDVPIEAKMVTRAIKSAQTQVEQQNFEIRKYVLKYDEVMNQQRKVIYAERLRILEGENLKEQAHGMLVDVVTAYVDGATAEGYAEDWDLETLWTALKTLYPVGIDHHDLLDSDAIGEPGELTREELLDALIEDAERAYAVREKQLEEIAGEGAMRQLERNVLLNVVDRKWREHLYEMDYLKEGINLRAVAQKDPVVEYQREGYDMFTGMLDAMKEESVGFLFNVTVEAVPATPGSAGGTRRRADRARRVRRPGRGAGAGRRAGCHQGASGARTGLARQGNRRRRPAADLHRAFRGRLRGGAALTAAGRRRAAPSTEQARAARSRASSGQGRQGQRAGASSGLDQGGDARQCCAHAVLGLARHRAHLEHHGAAGPVTGPTFRGPACRPRSA